MTKKKVRVDASQDDTCMKFTSTTINTWQLINKEDRVIGNVFCDPLTGLFFWSANRFAKRLVDAGACDTRDQAFVAITNLYFGVKE